jgi:hypothetical protein
MQMGTSGEKTVASVAKVNKLSVTSLTTQMHPGDRVLLPYASSFRPYILKEAYRTDPIVTANIIRDIPGYVSSIPPRSMNLIVAASDSACAGRPSEESWPFSGAKLRSVLAFNSERRSAPLRKAVIAIADTGADPTEDRIFLDINTREIPNNNIDDDSNGYVDDYSGVNMDTDVAGFPALNEEYRYNWHGTHVAGIALGTLRDPELTKLVKERIAIKVINLVQREVLQVGDQAPTTRFSIPNNFVLDALRYANEEPVAQIINLSVEGDQSSGLENALANNLSLVVAAAGNDGIDISESEKYPAAARSRNRLIAVAAHDGTGGLAGFSNWGMSNVEIAAPGCLIDSILPGGKRGTMSGTSQAAPFVSFAAGLLYAEGLTIPQIKERILLTTDFDHAKLGNCMGPTGRCVGSEGRLDIIKALSIYQDIVVTQRPDGSQNIIFGRIGDRCIQLNGRCYDTRTELRRFVHDLGAKQGECWIKSRDNRTSKHSCAIDGAIQFQATGASQTTSIALDRVIDFVSAVR